MKWHGVAGASGAVARAPWQPHHATNWFARAADTRQDHSRSTTFWPTSARSCPSQFPQHHRSPPGTCFATEDILSLHSLFLRQLSPSPHTRCCQFSPSRNLLATFLHTVRCDSHRLVTSRTQCFSGSIPFAFRSPFAHAFAFGSFPACGFLGHLAYCPS